jgi:hypothetical protein
MKIIKSPKSYIHIFFSIKLKENLLSYNYQQTAMERLPTELLPSILAFVGSDYKEREKYNHANKMKKFFKTCTDEFIRTHLPAFETYVLHARISIYHSVRIHETKKQIRLTPRYKRQLHCHQNVIIYAKEEGFKLLRDTAVQHWRKRKQYIERQFVERQLRVSDKPIVIKSPNGKGLLVNGEPVILKPYFVINGAVYNEKLQAHYYYRSSEYKHRGQAYVERTPDEIVKHRFYERRIKSPHCYKIEIEEEPNQDN